MSDKRKNYKVIDLKAVVSVNHQMETLIAAMTEGVQLFSTNSGITYYNFNSRIEYFVFLRDSSTARYLANKIDQVCTLRINEFVIDEIDFYTERISAYFHEEYIAARNEKQILENVNSDTELKIYINEVVLYFNIDMYFYSLFAYILEKERLNGFESPSLNKIFENYKKLASALIVSLCQFKTRYLFNLASSDILVFNNEYSEVMEHFGPLQGEIAVYVSRRENIQFSILTAFDEGHDEETGYLTDFPIFFTHCLYIAFDIAFKRITENLNNEDLMAHEVLHLENACLIKLFTTPKGSLNVKKLVKLANDGKLDDYIDDYFKLNGIIRVKEESMKKQLGTRFIFSVEENSEIFYYKRRVIDEFYTDYGELDRKNPLKALLNQCQLNLYRL